MANPDIKSVASNLNHHAYVAGPETRSPTGTRPHVAVLFYRIGPYHYARLKAAGARLRVTAVEFSNVDLTYAWDLVEGSDGFDRRTLFSGTPARALKPNCIFKRVGETLDQLRPQAVAIPGWYDRCSLAALKWCQANDVPTVVMSETTAWDDQRQWWKEALKRRIVSLCRAGLAGGSAHADYLEQLGMGREKIFTGYDAVDNHHFADKADEARSRKLEVGRKYGLPEKYFLASARFVEKKNLSRLIEAYALYRQKSVVRDRKTEGSDQGSPPWDLVLLGDGPLKPTLDSQLSTLNLQQHVHLPGFKQYDELPVYYGLADVFIHASTTEQWGLVVNEAMASGLPVLVSHRCGCAADLVQEGVNGFTFDPYDVEKLASLMFKLSTLDSQLSAFGAASRKIIGGWGTERFADGLQRAVECALRSPPPGASRTQKLILEILSRR
jgi:glycosyltransferase involved in cell wall biosynthesis